MKRGKSSGRASILLRLLTICQYATLNLQYVQNASSCETPPTTITVLVDQELRNRLARTALRTSGLSELRRVWRFREHLERQEEEAS